MAYFHFFTLFSWIQYSNAVLALLFLLYGQLGIIYSLSCFLMNICSSYIISFNLHFQKIQKSSCDSDVALRSECSFSFIYLPCIKLINLNLKFIIHFSEGYMNTIKHENKTEPEF